MTKRRSPLTWVLTAALALAPGAFAQNLQPITDGGAVETEVGNGYLFTAPGTVERAALADDSVARLQLIDSRELLISGLAPGETTLFLWLADGSRYRHDVRVMWDLDLLRDLLQKIDGDVTLRPSNNGRVLVLTGEIDDEAMERQIVARANSLVGGGERVSVVSALDYPTAFRTPDQVLTEALQSVDPRIRVRRVQVGNDPDLATDTYILEGRVRTVPDLVRAVVLAERQLGGSGMSVRADEQMANGANGGNDQGQSGGGGLGGIGGLAGVGGRNRLPQSGLTAQVARGLLVSSESGRVVSLLKVDHIPQILVSIRALEIDRRRANKVGINYAISGKDFDLGSRTGPQAIGVGSSGRSVTADVLGGNLAGAFIDGLTNVAAAIDFLENNAIARSVSEPNILALSGEIASVLVGGEIPIQQTTSNNVFASQSVFFQQFGVKLLIRPTLGDDGVITLEVSPSIVSPSAGLGVGGTPGFTVQSVQTTARVTQGQSLVIGGLLSFAEGIEEAKVPGLAQIPILKALFKWKRKNREQTELIFAITPHVLPTTSTPREFELPPIEWPEGTKRWRESFDPQLLGPDGVPSTFIPQAAEDFSDSYQDESGDDYRDDFEADDDWQDDSADDWEEDWEDQPVPAPQDDAALRSFDLPASFDDDAALLREASGLEPFAPHLKVGVETREFTPEPADGRGALLATEPIEVSDLEAPTVAPAEPIAWSPDEPATSRVAAEDLSWLTADTGSSRPAAVATAALIVSPEIDPCLSFRTGPSQTSDRTHCLVAGAELQVLERIGEWAKVESESGIVGWVDGSFLWRAEDCDESCRAKIEERSAPSADLRDNTATGDDAESVATISIDNERSVWVVSRDVQPCLNLRAEPSVDASARDCLMPEAKVWKLGRLSRWIEVQTESGAHGWVDGRFLEQQANCGADCSFAVVAHLD